VAAVPLTFTHKQVGRLRCCRMWHRVVCEIGRNISVQSTTSVLKELQPTGDVDSRDVTEIVANNSNINRFCKIFLKQLLGAFAKFRN
jgi:hypothetical protein